MWCEICHRFNHNTDACKKITEDERGNNGVDDAFDGLEEAKPTTIDHGAEGMA